MEAPNPNSIPIHINDFILYILDPEYLIRDFIIALNEFGVKYRKDPDFRTIWIESKPKYVEFGKYPHITVQQGDIEIMYAEYPKYNAISLFKDDKTKTISPFRIKKISYMNDSLVIEY